MKTLYTYYKVNFTFIIIFCFRIMVNGQSAAPILQHIVFKDKVLENNLNAFIDKSGAKAIFVRIERREKAYLYKLAGVYSYERIRDYPTSLWGEWHNRIVVFSAGKEINQVCTILNATAFSNLLHYVRPLLPDSNAPLLVNGKKVGSNVVIAEGLEWTFKVENSKEVWLYDNEGYDSRDLPIPEPK